MARIDAVTLDDLRRWPTSCGRPSGCRAAGIGPDEDAFRAAVACDGDRRRMIRVAVAGAAGRMGQAVCAAVEAADDLELAGRADPALGTTIADVLDGADVARRLHAARPGRPPTRRRPRTPACTS